MLVDGSKDSNRHSRRLLEAAEPQEPPPTERKAGAPQPSTQLEEMEEGEGAAVPHPHASVCGA